jgi:hypothetical protein
MCLPVPRDLAICLSHHFGHRSGHLRGTVRKTSENQTVNVLLADFLLVLQARPPHYLKQLFWLELPALVQHDGADESFGACCNHQDRYLIQLFLIKLFLTSCSAEARTSDGQ